MLAKTINHNLYKLVKFLNNGHYHSGDSLAKQLNKTRAAVWKNIQLLRSYGVNIVSSKNKGYLLESPLILLSASEIKNALSQQLSNIELKVFESIDSTNNYLRQHLTSSKITACLAEQQIKGKGRLNRTWDSPFGKNIYLSIAYKFEQDLSELSGLSLVVSLSTIKVLANYGIVDLMVKWPNDILCNGQKISGNLIEVVAESNGYATAIIGVGVNVNQNDNYIAMQDCVHSYIDRNIVAAKLINTLACDLELFIANGLEKFADERQAYDFLYNKSITIIRGSQEFTGIAKGINQHGHLLLEIAGKVIVFSSGDVTIKK